MKKWLLWIVLPVMLLSLAGCSQPPGKPDDIVQRYVAAVDSGQNEAAYALLTAAIKNKVSPQDFALRNKLQAELGKIKAEKITRTGEQKNRQLGGILYPEVVEFQVNSTISDPIDNNKEIEASGPLYVVNDQGAWKVHSKALEDVKTEIAREYNYLGYAYRTGKGKTKSAADAVAAFKKSLEYKEIPETLRQLSIAYNDLNRFDDAVAAATKAVSSATNNESKSDCLNTLGVIYYNHRDFAAAQKYFQASLQANPQNQYAATNLSNAKKLTSSK
ncbi:Hypothetical protein LUCI_1735 [Lucifera butyrica]|uniref:Uncharacterized protein n=1 Tax=Lucifera butyrica TaxID=1351585 RepID=A0A498R8A0_9FIRM|nr:tetratricopeptide repeat protein [Lucifera butyrica]VBB06502.1 Hypothetical protein LUCI_1735 [Lucifera butyrica]